jgi:hypothetical protein
MTKRFSNPASNISIERSRAPAARCHIDGSGPPEGARAEQKANPKPRDNGVSVRLYPEIRLRIPRSFFMERHKMMLSKDLCQSRNIFQVW